MHIKSQGFFLLRRPQFSIDTLLTFYQTIGSQYELYEHEIIRLLTQPVILEAVYLASPNLYKVLTELVSGNCKADKKELIKSLHKYLIRMSSRSTPYGLFAGCAIGEFSSSSCIRFDPHTPHFKHARLDMNYVTELVSGLLKNDNIRQQIKFYPNTSMYRVGYTYRFIEGITKNKRRNYTLTSVKINSYLEKVIELANNGAHIQSLIKQLISNEVSFDEAKQFVNELIDAQLLISELEVTVTGDEFFKVLINKLKKLKKTESEVNKLIDIQTILEQQNSDINKYHKIQSIITQHFVAASSKDLVQTDLYFNHTSCTLSEKFIYSLVNDFKKIIPLAQFKKNQDLENFKRNFYSRYEEREVSLLSVIDNETGIGYGHITSDGADNLPLLDQLILPAGNKTDSIDWTPLLKFKFDMYQEAITKGYPVIQLTDQKIADYQANIGHQPSLPNSFYLFGSLIASTEGEIDRGNFKFSLKAIGGPSGMNLLGRFCYGSEKLLTKVKQALKEEEAYYPDVILAEIAHLPEVREGNVIMRPSLRTFEIPYLAGPSINEAYHIKPEDLMISIPNGKEIILRSRRLGKRVIPRKTNAHNYSNGLPVYKFLCDLAHQEVNYSFNWNWDFLRNRPFLPRVEYNHLILSRAIWNINKEDFSFLQSKDINGVQGLRTLQRELNIPQYVQLVEGDKEMLINFESDFSVELLWDTLRKKGRARLREFLGESKHCFLQGQKGRYTNEIIIPLLNEQKAIIPANLSKPINKFSSVQRNFMPGSEWLYVKIYAGTKTSDQLLTSFIKPFAQKMLDQKWIDKWFFIRYGDPENHIRLRFHNKDDKSFWQHVLHALNYDLQPYLQQELIYKVQMDTYVRELERYGSSTIDQIETIFFADSQAVVNFLDLLIGDEGERYRWLMALRGTDGLLTDCGYELDQKKQLMERLQQNFFKEFNGNKQLHYALNDKYRAASKVIESFMDSANDQENDFDEAAQLLRKRSECIQPILSRIVPKLEIPIDSLVSSLIHMFLNRLFISKQRVHELVVYHYLYKYYGSTLARAKMVPKQICKKHIVI